MVKGEGVAVGVENAGLQGQCQREDEAGSKGEEAAKTEGDRVYEEREGGLSKGGRGLREVVEEEALHGAALKKWDVEEGERESGFRD
ncbi:hypothetical protein NL676_000787 [Syzygium grande]|nr:hypothetical protein NL676_000787 [Syzygium grande]